jgi:hypothetical protein
MDDLCGMLSSHYGLSIRTVRPAKRGFYAETHVVETPSERLFLKMIDRVRWPRESSGMVSSLPVLETLRSAHGILETPRPIRALSGELDFEYGTLAGALFEHVDGEHTYEFDVTLLADLYARLHSVNIGGIEIKRETGDIPYALGLPTVLDAIQGGRERGAVVAQAREFIAPQLATLLQDWSSFQVIRQRFVDELPKASLVITHSDGFGNVMRRADGITLIDWDRLALGPVERDFWMHIGNRRFEHVNKPFRDRYRFHRPDFVVDETRFRFYLYLHHFEYVTMLLQCVLDESFGERRAPALERLRGAYAWTSSVIRDLDEYRIR